MKFDEDLLVNSQNDQMFFVKNNDLTSSPKDSSEIKLKESKDSSKEILELVVKNSSSLVTSIDN